MNKGFLIRGSIILGIFTAIILAAIGCEFYFNKDQVMSNITNGDDAYLTIDGGITVTNQDLWNGMKSVEGMDYLEEYVDRILLADYIAMVDEDMVNEEILYLKYYTTDPDKIAEIQEDEEIHAKYIESFEQNVRLLGYDPDDVNSLTELLELGIAKKLYTEEKILAETDSDSSYFIKDTALENLYVSQNRGDVCTIDLRFGSTKDAENVFTSFNLVPGYTSDNTEVGIGLYDPSANLDDENNPIPLKDVLDPTDFNDTNTTLLTPEEVFTYYVKMWNLLNPWETQIDEAVTQADFCTNYADIAVKNYTEMTEDKYTSDPYVAYAKKIFITMEDDEYSIMLNPTFGEFTILTYIVERDAKPLYANATAEEIEALRQELAEDMISDAAMTNYLVDLRNEAEFTIYDPEFKLKLEFFSSNSYDFSKDGSEVFLATFKDGDTVIEVTPDMLFAYMEEVVGLSYAIDLLKAEYLIASDYYTDFYGESRDVLTSTNENIVTLRDETMLYYQNGFLNNQFVTNGYDNTKMDLDEFWYLAFGQKTIEDIINYIFVPSELSGSFIFDNVRYAPALAYMEDLRDTHLSLDVEHLLFYVDMDFDLAPDDFSDFYDGLTPEEVTTFETMVDNLTADVNAYLAEEGNDFDSLVNDFANTLITDETSTWATYKQYGLFIQTQALGEINQTNVDNFDEAFGDEVKRIYGLYTVVSEDVEEFLSDRLIQSDFGIHMVLATEGANFEIPTAVYSYADSGDEVGTYADGSEGTTIIPSLEQIETYIAIQAGEEAKQLPQSVEDAIDWYFGDVFTAYTGGNGYNVMMMELILDSNPVFTGTLGQTDLEEQLAIYYNLTFPELFDPEAE